jgi:hypothetical protein
METIIARNKEAKNTTSNLILLDEKNQIKNREEFLSTYGIDRVIKRVFDEDMCFAFLKNKYDDFTNGITNDYFLTITKLDAEYGAAITKDSSHIYLVHLEPQLYVGDAPLTEWYYFNSKRYVGDTWWSSDDEINKDIVELPLISFFKKYKGF